MAKVILFGETGRAVVRLERTAIDAPASGAWTPDNLNAAEISGGVVADDVILRASDWEDVRVVAEFTGSFTGSETVTVQPLRSVYATAVPGRVWVPIGDPVDLAPHLGSSLVLADGGDLAFRITALTLDGGTNVTLLVTGGQMTRDYRR